MLWSSDVNVVIASYSNHHINAIVQGAGGMKWRCTRVYGHPENSQKQHTWTLLRRLAGLFTLPWLYFGDFNEILDLKEKLRSRERNLNMITEFREAVNDCKLMDLKCRGYLFTWSNRSFGPHYVEERLDRFLESEGWRSSSFDLMVSNLISWGSDHSPIMLEMQNQKRFLCFKRKRKPRVHYEDMWSHYEECRLIVEEEWRQWGSRYEGDPVQSFQKAANCSMGRLLA